MIDSATTLQNSKGLNILTAINNERANTLSHIASKSLPNSDTKLYLRAINPSNTSVNENTKMNITSQNRFLFNDYKESARVFPPSASDKLNSPPLQGSFFQTLM